MGSLELLLEGFFDLVDLADGLEEKRVYLAIDVGEELEVILFEFDLFDATSDFFHELSEFFLGGFLRVV